MDLKTKFDRLKGLLDDIVSRNVLVIVEGKNDAEALDNLGVDNILEFSSFHKVMDEVRDLDEVVLLVDLDSHGKSIYSRLNSMLIRNGVRVDDSLRDFLFQNTDLNEIEGLDSYFFDLERSLRPGSELLSR